MYYAVDSLDQQNINKVAKSWKPHLPRSTLARSLHYQINFLISLLIIQLLDIFSPNRLADIVYLYCWTSSVRFAWFWWELIFHRYHNYNSIVPLMLLRDAQKNWCMLFNFREEAGDSSFVKVVATDGGGDEGNAANFGSGGSSVDQRERNDPSESPRGSLSG